MLKPFRHAEPVLVVGAAGMGCPRFFFRSGWMFAPDTNFWQAFWNPSMGVPDFSRKMQALLA